MHSFLLLLMMMKKSWTVYPLEYYIDPCRPLSSWSTINYYSQNEPHVRSLHFVFGGHVGVPTTNETDHDKIGKIHTQFPLSKFVVGAWSHSRRQQVSYARDGCARGVVTEILTDMRDLSHLCAVLNATSQSTRENNFHPSQSVLNLFVPSNVPKAGIF